MDSCLFCVGPVTGLYDVGFQKWNMLPAASFLCCSTSETRTEKTGNPLREASRPKQSLVGADCHVPKVTSWPNSTSHSFLGAGQAAWQGSLSTVQTSTVPCIHCVFVQSNRSFLTLSEPHLLNWSTLHVSSAGFLKKQHNSTLHLWILNSSLLCLNQSPDLDVK